MVVDYLSSQPNRAGYQVSTKQGSGPSYKRLKVDRNWHITCDYQYYSVPFQLVGESVTVRLTPQLVSI
ncbi:Mu transposase domain-containing protein, partial [Corynebacterium striatum]|uniref:Mu transposase domain-containing protein n=1 Tax=Corynebacterium striatum TaxID=43770 RepID=UPI003B5C99E0